VLRLAIAVLSRRTPIRAPGRALAGGDCDLVGALGCGIAKAGKPRRPSVWMWAPMGDVGIAERRDMLGAEARDDLHHHISMAPSACRSQAAITRVLPAVPRPWLRSPPR